MRKKKTYGLDKIDKKNYQISSTKKPVKITIKPKYQEARQKMVSDDFDGEHSHKRTLSGPEGPEILIFE